MLLWQYYPAVAIWCCCLLGAAAYYYYIVVLKGYIYPPEIMPPRGSYARRDVYVISTY
jgi:hypothetical protein